MCVFRCVPVLCVCSGRFSVEGSRASLHVAFTAGHGSDSLLLLADHADTHVPTTAVLGAHRCCVGISSLEASRLRPMHRGAEASHGETAPLCAGRPLSRGEDAVPDGCIDPSTVDRFTECDAIR
eukprot:COSAG01_NODE_2119_length_8380_cov_44.533510_4_plen_124_part_00